MDFVDLGQIAIPQEIIELLPSQNARRYKVIPVAVTDSGLIMATSNPLDFDTFDAIGHLLKRDIDFVCATPAQIKTALIKYYGTADEAVSSLEQSLGTEQIQFGDGPIVGVGDTDSGDAPVIKMVSLLLLEAHKMRASDIHLEPLEKRFRVRFRIDGVLHEMTNPPKKLQSAICSRIKIMTGSMSIAEKRLPQDGRIKVRIEDAEVDIRVSIIPMLHGEAVVMRLLRQNSTLRGLAQIGMAARELDCFQRVLRLPHGIILVTGPTGSGKTSTLYTALNEINDAVRKIITVEDPVEYQLKGVNQIQVNEKSGLTFARGLRSILRHDPDVVLIGEIRDQETAQIAVQASLTGHLVFSTLHTNDAPGAVTRLVDMGVEPYLVASSLEAVLAQRLVRVLCPHCKQQDNSPTAQAFKARLGIPASTVLYRSIGCRECRNTGFFGRHAIFEWMDTDEEIRQLILKNASTDQVRNAAQRAGMKNLAEDGWRLVAMGITTVEEVLGVTTAKEVERSTHPGPGESAASIAVARA
jgi:general secretion pathway protein E/type IV pilus assembly protein PilB